MSQSSKTDLLGRLLMTTTTVSGTRKRWPQTIVRRSRLAMPHTAMVYLCEGLVLEQLGMRIGMLLAGRELIVSSSKKSMML
jgi:hypothetical protein